MRIIGIDPGPEKSGVIIIETGIVCGRCLEIGWRACRASATRLHGDEIAVSCATHEENGSLLNIVTQDQPFGACVIERPAARGQIAGKTTMNTAFWAGVFAGAMHDFTKTYTIRPNDIRATLAGKCNAPDVDIKAAVSEFVGKPSWREAVGKKKAPGPLYGLSGSHQWDALAAIFGLASIGADNLTVGGLL